MVEIGDHILTTRAELEEVLQKVVLRVVRKVPIEHKSTADLENRLFSAPKIWQQFGVSKVTLEEWASAYNMPFVQRGRNRYYQGRDVMRAIEQSKEHRDPITTRARAAIRKNKGWDPEKY